MTLALDLSAKKIQQHLTLQQPKYTKTSLCGYLGIPLK